MGLVWNLNQTFLPLGNCDSQPNVSDVDIILAQMTLKKFRFQTRGGEVLCYPSQWMLDAKIL